MSNKKEATAAELQDGVAEQAAPPAPAPETAPAPARAPKFTIERLRRDCFSLFGVTVSTFDGATFKLKGEHTVEEMRAHIKKWQSRQVRPDKTKKEVK